MYFFLDKKVPKNQERNDIQPVSFFCLDVALVLLWLRLLSLDPKRMPSLLCRVCSGFCASLLVIKLHQNKNVYEKNFRIVIMLNNSYIICSKTKFNRRETL